MILNHFMWEMSSSQFKLLKYWETKKTAKQEFSLTIQTIKCQLKGPL